MGDEYIPTRQQDLEELESTWQDEHHQGVPQLGQILLDRYKIFGVKQGGFGIVLFVTDLETDQDYAVKTYKSEFAKSIHDLERFKKEMDFWISLDPHPNVVKAYSVEVVDGRPYLFMEYISGENLHDKLHRDCRLDLDVAISFAYQLCLGMESANKVGEIAHLDLKPDNVLIDREMILKVTDFGLAKHIRSFRGEYQRLNYGSWPYAPPERFRNDVEDSRSDIYSAGMIFYEMLTGKLPYPFELSDEPEKRYEQLSYFHFEGGADKLRHDLYYKHSKVHISSAEIGSILSGCITNYPQDRFRNFTELCKTLERKLNLELTQHAVLPSDSNLYNHALAFYRIGNYSKALSIFNQLLRKYPDDASIWLDTARVLLACDQLEDAIDFARKSVQLNPKLIDKAQRLFETDAKIPFKVSLIIE